MKGNYLNKFSKLYEYLLIFLHVVYNVDFGCIQRRTPRSKRAIQILTLTKCVCTSVALLYLDGFQHFAYVYYVVYASIELLCIAIILSFSYDCSFYRLESTLSSMDSTLGSPSAIKAKVVLVVLGSQLITIIAFSMACTKFYDECGRNIMYSVYLQYAMVGMQMVYIVCSFIFYAVYCRLSVLVTNVKNGSPILESLDLYKIIFDALERGKKSFDFLYVASIIFQLPLFINGVYLYLRNLKIFDRPILGELVRLHHTFQTLILLMAPSITAGLTTSKASELQLVLLDRLLYERNEPHSGAIELFLDYLQARPMKFTLFKIIPLDWSLPILLINLCITYQIVVVQLTHLY